MYLASSLIGLGFFGAVVFSGFMYQVVLLSSSPIELQFIYSDVVKYFASANYLPFLKSVSKLVLTSSSYKNFESGLSGPMLITGT